MMMAVEKPHKKPHYGSREHKLKAPVVGMNYRVRPPEQYSLAETVPHIALLVRDPANLYDENAVEVRIDDGDDSGMHIGYVPREVAAILAPKLDSGEIMVVSALVTEIDADRGVGELLISFRKKIHSKA